ncbi:UNVERIFIED_CONTAM: hypothetical protein K2H54_038744 [Gekko kuhli]
MATFLCYPGKVAIVTGGIQGIGLAIVREFVEKGQEIQRELQSSGCPGDAYSRICDVRKESDIKGLQGLPLGLGVLWSCGMRAASFSHSQN